MRVIDHFLLGTFREAGKCEWCGDWQPRRQPHHLFAKGMGGGGRLDVRVNLMGLCVPCHHEAHAGNIPRGDLLALVARREKTTPGAIRAAVHALRRRPKP